MIRKLPLTLTLLLALSCTTERQYEDYGIQSDAEITLTQENHSRGWGNSECYACHVHSNIHMVDGYDPAKTEMARRYTQDNGVRSCRGCHGTNGVIE